MLISLKKSSVNDKRVLFSNIRHERVVAITVVNGDTVVCFSGNVLSVCGNKMRFAFADSNLVGSFDLGRIRSLTLA